MSYYPHRRQVRIRWRGAALTLLLVAVLAIPVSGLVAVLLGIAHSIDPAIPPLGSEAIYPLLATTWVVHWLIGAEVNIDE